MIEMVYSSKHFYVPLINNHSLIRIRNQYIYYCLFIVVFAILIPAGMDCGEVEPPRKGFVMGVSSTLYGDTIRYACEAGHVLEGAAEATCLHDGTWSDKAPVCRGEYEEYCLCLVSAVYMTEHGLIKRLSVEVSTRITVCVW